MVYSTRRFVLCPILCHFVLVILSPFSIVITSLGEEIANLSAFRKFVRFVLVWNLTLGNVGWYLMLCLWSGPPESNCWFSFAPAFHLFRAVQSLSLLHLCN